MDEKSGLFGKPVLAGFALALAVAPVRAQTSRNMTQLAKFSPPGALKVSSGIWGHTDANGKEYALLTTREPGGLHIIDISVPTAPKHVNFIASSGNSIWQEVNGFGKTAYKVSQQNRDGLQIIDLSPLDRGQPAVLVKSTTTWFQVAHTCFVDTTTAPPRLFVTYGSTAGVMIFTLADPQNPVLIRTLEGETHDVFARGNRMYASNQYRSTLTIWDITDVANTAPRKIGIIDFKQVSPANGEPTNGISHNAWPSEDDKYLFTTEETVGTSVKAFDITDFSLTNPPKMVGSWVADKKIIPHNVYVKGDYLYVAHYTAGLRVLDISDPAHMAEVAFHKPSTSTELYGGSWGAYPWFKSGSIIHGDDIQGLFVEKVDKFGTSVRERADGGRLSINPLQDGRIHLRLPRGGAYVLSVYSTSGRELFQMPGAGRAGPQTLTLGRAKPAGGNYLIRLQQGNLAASAPVFLR